MNFAHIFRLGGLGLAVMLESVHNVDAAVRLGSATDKEQHAVVADAAVKSVKASPPASNLRAAAAAGRRVLNPNANPNARPFGSGVCTAAVAEVQGASPGEDSTKIACVEEGNTDVMRDLDVGDKWVNDAVKVHGLEPGDEILIGEASTVGPDGKVHPANANPGIAKGKKKKGPPGAGAAAGGRRRLATVTGDKSILAVRVVTSDASYTNTEAQLSNAVFGNGVDSVNIASQYAACSHNKLTISKAADRTGNTKSISNGVVTIQVSNASTETDSVVRPAVTAALQAEFGTASGLADHLMYCLPPGTMSGIAYAYINSWNSVYSDLWCNYVSAQMHEIGHNINLAHSNEGGTTYADQTGMMGYSYGQSDGPVMCFNNAKNWQLGWFSDRQQIVEKDACIESLEIVGQARYSSDPSRPVIVKINANTANDFYLGFNHKIGANSGTVEAGNQVTIQSATTEGGSGTPGGGYAESALVAKLGVNGEWTSPDLGEGKTITVKVTGIDSSATGFATVDITSSTCTCATNADCDDGNTCNGQETCNTSTGLCEPGTAVGGERTIAVDLLTDNYPTETTWDVKNPAGGVVLSSSSGYAANTPYSDSVQVCPTAGDFSFTINDSYGDGICCSYGSGSYAVKLDGVEVASGGSFTTTETKTFPVGPAGPAPTAAPVTPPPTNAPVPPTPNPTKAPTPSPTSNPTSAPVPPTPNPTYAPTLAPTSNPTNAPTLSPTPNPTNAPTKQPTRSPTLNPTSNPTDAPVVPPACSTFTKKNECPASYCAWENGRNGGCVPQAGNGAEAAPDGCLGSGAKCGHSDECCGKCLGNGVCE